MLRNANNRQTDRYREADRQIDRKIVNRQADRKDRKIGR
jgi:hypothetical protein